MDGGGPTEGVGRAAVVTILFTDLVGSTEILDRIGDDDAELLRRTHFGVLREAVRQHGGAEVKSLGDGLMVVFPSVLDALEAAVEMQQGVDLHNREHPDAPFEVRVGLHVGEPIRAEEDYFGRPVVIARRICDSASGGQILASQLVADLAGGRSRHPLVSMGPGELKGLSASVDLVQVEWSAVQPASPNLPEPLNFTGQFAGRAAELEKLVDAWKSATAGERRAVLLGGEPGIGKTRLTAELARRVSNDGKLVLFGRCDEDLTIPYQPWMEALRPLLPLVAGRVPEPSLTELRRVVPDSSLARETPVTGRRGDAEMERLALFQSVVVVLAAAAPLLLVLDDLHWADEPSLLLLRHVLRAHPAPAVTVVGTYRDTDLARTHPLGGLLADLRREKGVDRVALRGLGPEEVEDLLERTAGHSLDDRGSELASSLHRETQGNPFFVIEVLRHLVESGAIYQVDGRWSSDLTIADLGLPEGVREVIGRRLGRLADETVQILRAAAVVGPRFQHRLVEAVLDCDDDAVLDAIDEAVAAGLLQPAADGTTFEFSHALVRQTLLEELSGPRRMRLHRRVAETIERLPEVERDIGALAFHYAEAAVDGVIDRAVDYSVMAARLALERLAYEEAIIHLERGLEVLELEPVVDRLRRCDLLLLLATTRGTLYGWAEARDPALAAAADARVIGDPDRFGEAAMIHLPDAVGAVEASGDRSLLPEALEMVGGDRPALRSFLLSFHAVDLQARAGQLEQAQAASAEAVDLARISSDAVALSRALSARMNVLEELGDVEGILATVQELGTLDADEPDRLDLFDPRAAIARAHLMTGAPELYWAELARSEKRYLSTRSWPAWYWWVAGRGVRGLIQGRFEDVETAASELLASGGANRNPANVAAAQLFLAWRDQGRLEDLLPLIEERAASQPGIAAFRAGVALIAAELGDLDRAGGLMDGLVADHCAGVRRDQVWLAFLLVSAEAAAILGHRSAAKTLEALIESRSGLLAAPAAGTIFMGAVDRYLGMLAMTLGDLERALRLFRSARVSEQRLGAPAAEARTRLWCGRLLAQLGDEVAVEDEIGPAVVIADQLGMQLVASEARQLLARS